MLLLAVVALSGWIGWSVMNNRLDHQWPVRLLRWFHGGCSQILDISVLNLFLISLDCSYFDIEPLNVNRVFPKEAPSESGAVGSWAREPCDNRQAQRKPSLHDRYWPCP